MKMSSCKNEPCKQCRCNGRQGIELHKECTKMWALMQRSEAAYTPGAIKQHITASASKKLFRVELCIHWISSHSTMPQQEAQLCNKHHVQQAAPMHRQGCACNIASVQAHTIVIRHAFRFSISPHRPIHQAHMRLGFWQPAHCMWRAAAHACTTCCALFSGVSSASGHSKHH
jgi:hypothetical protein